MDQPLGRIALVVRFKVPSKARFSVGGALKPSKLEKKNRCVYAWVLATVTQSVYAVVSAYIRMSEPILVLLMGHS